MEFRVYEDIEVILTLLDMTIQEFANELGVSYSTVSRWKEGGKPFHRPIWKRYMNMRSKSEFV